MAQLQRELQSMNGKLEKRIRRSWQRLQQSQFVPIMLQLMHQAPWMVSTWTNWSLRQLQGLQERVQALVDAWPTFNVTGYTRPVVDTMLSQVAARAGFVVARAQRGLRNAFSHIPLVRPWLQVDEHAVERLLLDGNTPTSPLEWQRVYQVLVHSKQIASFVEHEYPRGWPVHNFYDGVQALQDLLAVLVLAVRAKEMSVEIDSKEAIRMAREAHELDARRTVVKDRLASLASESVASKVVYELGRSFSADTQSHLIRFAQIAGKSKFRSTASNKLTPRQRRRRQEYLDAFDQCCRCIPCWILTSSQISDYLPAECMFDLIICDEASQSEVVSILPGMLRGKQWLIVGDTKQVSPTDCFVAEDQIESLRASLPQSPFAQSLLPGQSFFDLCAQAFPRGRVVLSEHFRCAQQIIAYSNANFYDNSLIPLRLPTSAERMDPPLIDVKVDGVKNGKVNEIEADEIVRRVQTLVQEPVQRTIGIISLIGDEQSRLIRGRLLDTLGPKIMAEHEILVGDPPTFQGAERDVVFLSLVASPGHVPTQSQLMHFQRANVAMSRARDQCTLVRSIDLTDIPSSEDVKGTILEFFASASETTSEDTPATDDIRGFLCQTLQKRGFTVRGMGVVWKQGISVEQGHSRAALCIEAQGESLEEWKTCFAQQQAIERVGWKCMRVDAISLLADFDSTMELVLRFLANAGLELPVVVDDVDFDEDEEGEDPPPAPPQPAQEETVVVVSSDDEDDDSRKSKTPLLGGGGSHTTKVMDPKQFGTVVDMSFLSVKQEGDEDVAMEDTKPAAKRPEPEDDNDAVEETRTTKRARRTINYDEGEQDEADEAKDQDTMAVLDTEVEDVNGEGK